MDCWFLAGIAGMLALTSAESGALVGVLISVNTIPAAANAAVALTKWVPTEAIGSAIQLPIDLSAIAVAKTLTPCCCSGRGPSSSPGGAQPCRLPNEGWCTPGRDHPKLGAKSGAVTSLGRLCRSTLPAGSLCGGACISRLAVQNGGTPRGDAEGLDR